MVLMLAKSPQSSLYVEGRQEVNANLSWARQERRRRVRTPLHLLVVFSASEHRSGVETTTRNLSSRGFYCTSPVPFAVNESALCHIKIPIYQPNRSEHVLSLECRVRVVRVELLGEEEYGVGCEIEDYCFPKAVDNGHAALTSSFIE